MTSEPAPIPPISSLKILVGSLAIIPLRFRVFAETLAVPFVLYVAFDCVWLTPSVVDLYNRFRWPMFVLSELIDLALYTLAAVTTHRIILLGASAVPRYGIEWAPHTTRFFVLALLLTSANYAAAFVGAALVGNGILGGSFVVALALSMLPTLLVLALMFVFARLLLVFPAAAVGQPITLRDSWELTRRRQLLMFVITIVFPALIFLPTSLLSDASTVGYLLSSFISLPALVVTVVLLSFAYQQIRKERGSA